MTRALCALGAVCLSLTAARAGSPCSCGTASVDAALTRRDETWGLRLSERAEFAQGTYNAHGMYRGFGANENSRSFDLAVLAAFRPFPRLELSAQAVYGRSSLTEGGQGRDLRGAADWFAHARWEILDQTPNWASIQRPFSVALVGGVLAPVGRADPSLNRGLGAWELSLGSVVDHDFSPWNRLSAFVEGGLRLPDRSLGVERRLGPRLYAQATASHWLSGATALSAFSSLRWEADAALDGRVESGSGTRLWQVGVGAAFQPSASRVRTTGSVRYAPHVAGLDVNTTASTLLDVSVSFSN